MYELNIEQLELASHNTALQRAQIPWIKTDSVVSCVLLFALVGIKLVLSLTHTRRYQRRNEWNEQNTTHIHLTSHSNHLPYTLHTFLSLLLLVSVGVWFFAIHSTQYSRAFERVYIFYCWDCIFLYCTLISCGFYGYMCVCATVFPSSLFIFHLSLSKVLPHSWWSRVITCMGYVNSNVAAAAAATATTTRERL